MTSGRIWAACLGIVAALIAVSNPILFVPILGLVVIFGAGGLGFVAIERGHRIDELTEEVARLGREHAEELATEQRKAEILRDALMVQDQVSADLAGQLQDAEIRHLHAVRDLPVADEPVPIHDRLLIDHWIEDVQAWGEDVES